MDTGSSRLAQILMMQAAHLRHFDHLPTFRRFNWSRNRTVVRERPVWSDFLVIFEIGFKSVPELPFIEHNHSIQAFSANGTPYGQSSHAASR